MLFSSNNKIFLLIIRKSCHNSHDSQVPLFDDDLINYFALRISFDQFNEDIDSNPLKLLIE